MSTKSLLISVGIVAVLLIASHYFTYKTAYSKGYDDAVATLTIDSTKTDTITVVKYDTVYIKIHHYTRADVDTVHNVTGDALIYKMLVDTSVVIAEDTVVVLKQDISFAPSFITDGGGNEWTVYTKDDFKGYFDIITDIQIRPVEKLIEVTKTVFRTVKVPVPADPPFYNTFWFGSVFATIAILLIGLLL